MAQTPEEKAAAKAAKEREGLLAKLADLNVTVTGDETNDQLAEMLDKAKADAKATADAEKAAAKAAKSSSGPITVYYRDHRGRGTKRVFSADDHGENFAALADEFKATNARSIIADEKQGEAAVAEAARLDADERARAGDGVTVRNGNR